MKHFDWNPVKNTQLMEERDVSFEDVTVAISEGKLLGVLEHPNQKLLTHQKK